MFKHWTCPISHGNAPNFDDPQKTGNYTTRKEIDEIGERQQLTTEAKRGLFYRVELLNGSKYRMRGEVPPNRRKRGKNGMRREGGEAVDIRNKQKRLKAERVV